MTTRIALIAALLALSLVWSSNATAKSIRCGVYIVSASGLDGPSMYEVLKKCGEPTFRLGRQWIYERTNQRTRTLVFNHDGRLEDIRTD